jgi:serine phosphatase RsbU (regulator of sigma subunit)/integral membrane sensor domain MASE1
MWTWPQANRWGPVGLFALTTLAYAGGSQLALLLIEVSGLSGVFFIPAGITVAFLLRLSRRVWWIVLLAAGAAEATMDLLAGIPADETAGFVAANVSEPLVGALVVARFISLIDLARLRHVWAFFVGAVVCGPAVGAAIGAAADRVLGGDDFLTTFLQWWLGDALGVVIVGSAILVWGSGPDRRSLITGWGIGLVAGSALLTAVIVNADEIPLRFLVVIPVLIAGALFGPRAVAVTALIAAAGVGLDLVIGEGPLIPGISDSSALILIKPQLGVFTLAGLVLSAEARERELATAGAVAAATQARLAEADRLMEHTIAVRLQRALLPEQTTVHPGVAVAARYEAGSEAMVVGGDWYDVFDLSGDRIGLTVGDVVGHGLEASAAMGRLRTAVATLAQLSDSPAQILTQLDRFAAGPNGTEFATACYAILDSRTGVLTYAAAGHPPMMVLASDGSTEWLMEGRSAPIHGSDVIRTEATMAVAPGSSILAFSDGLVERRGESLEDGLSRLETEARKLLGLTPRELCDRLLEAMAPEHQWNDDVVIVALRYETPELAVPGLIGGHEPRSEEVDQAADLEDGAKTVGEDDPKLTPVVPKALVGGDEKADPHRVDEGHSAQVQLEDAGVDLVP